MDSCCEDRLLGCSSQLRNKARTFGYVLHFLWIIAVTTVVWINEDNGDLPRSFPSDLCLNAASRGQQPTSSWQPLPDLAAPLATRLLCAPSALWGCCALSGSALHQPGLLCLAMPSAPWQPELPLLPSPAPQSSCAQLLLEVSAQPSLCRSLLPGQQLAGPVAGMFWASMAQTSHQLLPLWCLWWLLSQDEQHRTQRLPGNWTELQDAQEYWALS